MRPVPWTSPLDLQIHPEEVVMDVDVDGRALQARPGGSRPLSQRQAAAEAEEVVQEGAIQVVGAVIQVVPDETEDGKNCCVNFNDSNRTILKKVAGDKLQVSHIPIP